MLQTCTRDRKLASDDPQDVVLVARVDRMLLEKRELARPDIAESADAISSGF